MILHDLKVGSVFSPQSLKGVEFGYYHKTSFYVVIGYEECLVEGRPLITTVDLTDGYIEAWDPRTVVKFHENQEELIKRREEKGTPT